MNKMEIQKVHWTTDGDNVRLTMPLTKVNQEKRLVSGWATLDSVDQQGDVILAEASSRAFKRFRGNIREMHQPIAVGRLVDFKEEDYLDDTTGELYHGVYVTAYVSKGATDTWEKVLDGTLTGFSIGGEVIEDSRDFVKDNNGKGRTVRFVKDYSLNELSLVDNPCNQHANLVSIEKMADGSTMVKGQSVDVKAENIFYCQTDGTTVISETDEARECHKCDTSMKVIGWVESSDKDKVSKIKKAVHDQEFASNNNSGIIKTGTTTSGGNYTITINGSGINSTDIATTIASHLNKTQELNGGVNVADDNKADEAVEAGTGVNPNPDTTVEADQPGRDEANDKASQENVTAQNNEAVDTPVEEDNVEAGTGVDFDADNSEVAPEADFEKMVSSLKDVIEKGLAKNADLATGAIATVQSSVEELSKAVESKVSALNEKFTALNDTVESLGGTVETVEKSVKTVEDSTAIRKSGDIEPEDKTITKSVWGGRFLGISDLDS